MKVIKHHHGQIEFYINKLKINLLVWNMEQCLFLSQIIYQYFYFVKLINFQHKYNGS